MHLRWGRGPTGPRSKRKLKGIVHDHGAGEHDRVAVGEATQGQHTQAHGNARARVPAHGRSCVGDMTVSRQLSHYLSDFSANFQDPLPSFREHFSFSLF